MVLACHYNLTSPFYHDVYPSRELSVYKRYDTCGSLPSRYCKQRVKACVNATRKAAVHFLLPDIDLRPAHLLVLKFRTPEPLPTTMNNKARYLHDRRCTDTPG